MGKHDNMIFNNGWYIMMIVIWYWEWNSDDMITLWYMGKHDNMIYNNGWYIMDDSPSNG